MKRIVMLFIGFLCLGFAEAQNMVHHEFPPASPDTNCHADFSYHQTASLTIQFQDQSTGNEHGTCYWVFGDGSTSSTKNPLHHFFSKGTYSVALHTHDSITNCQSQITKSVYVSDSAGSDCHADYLYSYDSQNILRVQFTDQSVGSITGWSWNFGDPQSAGANISASQNPDHIFSQPGMYHVCLTSHGANNCTDTYCNTIEITDAGACQAQFSWHPDGTSVPAGIPYQFTDLSNGSGLHWNWSFGDGTADHEQNPRHFFAQTGTYYVCLTVYGQGCQSAWCQYVEVDNNSGCYDYFNFRQAGLSANFDGFLMNSAQGSFSWDFGDGTFAQGQSVMHTFTMPGIFPVSLHANDSAGCSATYLQNVSIGSNPQYHQVYGQAYTGNFPLQQGMAMIFSMDTVQNFYPFIASSNVDTNGIFIFPMVPEGHYYIHVLPTASTGYLPTYYGDVLNWQGSATIASGQVANPYNIHLIPAGDLMNGNGNISGAVHVIGFKNSLADKITMLLQDEQQQAIAYDQVSSAGDFTFPTLAFGTYYLKAEIAGILSDLVKVVISSEHPEATVNMTFEGSRIIGIRDISEELKAEIYPNPASGETRIRLEMNNPSGVVISVYSMTGTEMLRKAGTVNAASQTVTLDVSGLPSGIYTLRIVSVSGNTLVRKLVKI